MTWPLFISIGITGFLAFYAYNKRFSESAGIFATLVFLTTLWSLFYVLGLSSPNLEGKIFWLRMKYIPSTLVPILWLYFSLQFTHSRDWLNNRVLRTIAFTYIAVTWFVVFSSDSHGFMWKQVWIVPGLLEEESTHGFYFWVYLVVSYAALISSFIVYTRFYLRSPTVYKRQALTMVFGSAVPVAASVFVLAGWFDFVPLLDDTIFAFLISGIFFSWSLFGFRTFDLLPVAHDLVIKNMNMGLIVFDAHNQVIEINPVAQRTLKMKVINVIGRSADMIFKDEDIVFRKNDVRKDEEYELKRAEAGEDRYYSIHQSPIFNKRYEFSGRIMLMTDITDRKKNEIMLSNFATFDELSKIFNRRHFHTLAEKELNRAKRYERPLSIAIFDIDNFKSFNNTYGHSIGDQVVVHVTTLIKNLVRESDIFARFGGDEFICLFAETSKEVAISIIQRIQEMLNENPFYYEGDAFPITMSFGISHWDGDPNASMMDLIQNADIALLQAKRMGKDCYIIWEEGIRQRIQAH